MSRHYYDDDFHYGYFPPSRPREAKCGIKAQSKRGSFGESWWAKRWIAVLESFNIGARLGRGRSYARRGQVLSIDIGQGTVAAKVQGSRPTPYKVAIKVKTLAKAEWRKLADVLSQQAIFAAKLLAGEMPQDIEAAFGQAKLSLFPAKMRDLTTDCSCPDWSNPCKHIAAVYYLLGEEFDRDPFLIFRLRGIEREELIELIGSRAPATATHERDGEAPAPADAKGTAPSPSVPLAPAEPLPLSAEAFWGEGALPEDFFGEVRVPSVPAALPKRLGSLPFWRGQEKFLEALQPIYQSASAAGLGVFLAEPDGRRSEPPPK